MLDIAKLIFCGFLTKGHCPDVGSLVWLTSDMGHGVLIRQGKLRFAKTLPNKVFCNGHFSRFIICRRGVLICDRLVKSDHSTRSEGLQEFVSQADTVFGYLFERIFKASNADPSRAQVAKLARD